MVITITAGHYISKYFENPMIEKFSFFGAILIGIPIYLSNLTQISINLKISN